MKSKLGEIITVTLSKETAKLLNELAQQELRTMSQQAEIIIHNYFKDYNRVLELEKEKDFGVITEENLRYFLKKEENQQEYKYSDIEHYSFGELFQFWIKTFVNK